MITAELRKLTTVRSPWLLLAAGPLLAVAGVSGLVVSGGNMRDATVRNAALAHVGLAALATLILGILAVAGEYRHRTITDTYLSHPDRGRVVAAKVAVYSLLGACAGLVTSGFALAAVAVWWAAKGVPFPFSAGDTWRTIAGGIAVNACFAAIGVGIGALVRNVVAAIAATLVWLAVVEGIVGQLVGTGLARWLPFAASGALDRAGQGGLPQWGAAVLLVGYAAVFAGAAVVTTIRRDVP